MINFPIITRMEIRGFGLYPGRPGRQGLETSFARGLTLIVGANGLGKSTLVNILFRTLTGPFDIGGIDRVDVLGNLDLTEAYRGALRTLFANRVADHARQASIRLDVAFGSNTLSIERSLADLSITDLRDGSTPLPLQGKAEDNEKAFQAKVLELSGISSFGDWILILRYLVFYMEDRRALVWDPSAQREILRILFLDKEDSAAWRSGARKVVALDSEYRNLRVVLNKQKNNIEKKEKERRDFSGLETELDALRRARDEAVREQEGIDANIESEDIQRKLLRDHAVKLESEVDSVRRELASAKILHLDACLPSLSDSAKFILTELMQSGNCLACGAEAGSAQIRINEVLSSGRCVVCDGDNSTGGANVVSAPEFAEHRVAELQKRLKDLEHEGEATQIEAKAANEGFRRSRERRYELVSGIADMSLKIELIERQTPKGDGSVDEDAFRVTILEDTTRDKKADHDEEHAKFSALLETVTEPIFTHAAPIQEEFNTLAQNFLFEACEITWLNKPWKLGQTGVEIEFPAFVFRMSGSDFSMLTERTNPQEVSESQREFIDLAFRMALIKTAGHGESGTIIMDAPESSLDRVFVKNACNVLLDFGNKANNRLLITSNLIDGALLPTLIADLVRHDRLDASLVNLFEEAIQTRAILNSNEAYETAFTAVIQKAKEMAVEDAFHAR